MRLLDSYELSESLHSIKCQMYNIDMVKSLKTM